MIRKALASDLPTSANDECLIRICALNKAYGCDVPFIQYYTDEMGGYLSVMDGAAVLYVEELTDEWQLFLLMNPDICTLHCPGHIGKALSQDVWQGREGVVMRYCGENTEAAPSVCTEPYLPYVYDLLKDTFDGLAPFDYWYPDVSHRVRHGCSHIACEMRDNRVISTAMTVAETETEAIIGQVATDKAFRRQGLAGKCVKSVLSICKGKKLYILPAHKNAAKLYTDLGFVACGTWAELKKMY